MTRRDRISTLSSDTDLAARPAWWAAFGHREFRLFQCARLLSVLGLQMQSVAVGWQIYAITRRPLDLAWVGLVQFLPAVCLSPVTGHVADRHERRRILMVSYAAAAGCSAILAAQALSGARDTAAIYAALVGVGVARAFGGPAAQSILPSLVPAADFTNAVAWSSSLWQGATIFGPTLGGAIFAATDGAASVYLLATACSLIPVFLMGAMRPVGTKGSRGPSPGWSSLFAGVRYVWTNQIVLGALSLDLFAVLLGGATALLPVFARDVLGLGPWALGALRSAPALGAAVMGVVLALKPIERRVGIKMLGCVALFGLATVVFGLSRNFVVSLAALAVAGAADMVSVVVRSAAVQLATPDGMRGRVSAVNTIFIGASNELGEFESGLTAQWLGAVPAVVVGGIGTIVVVALWARRFPALTHLDRLSDASGPPKPEEPQGAAVA